MTLTEFLLARIAEDEQIAQEVRPHEYLTTRDRSTLIGGEERGYAFVQAKSGRVLAECEAKRRIVEEHSELYWYLWRGGERTGKCRMCAENEDAGHDGAPLVAWPCPTLRALAAVYADHPEYLEEWRP